MRICFFVLLGISLACSPSLAADSQWHWIKAGNTSEQWVVSEGMAEVSMANGRFSARLFRKDSNKDVQIILEGTIRNGRITAKETIQGSDFTGSAYSGTLREKKWRSEEHTSELQSRRDL